MRSRRPSKRCTASCRRSSLRPSYCWPCLFLIIEDGNFKTIRVTLKYGADKNEKIITGIKRISKPGLRVYAGKDEIPSVLGGLGIAILSTNQGIVTDKEARKLQVGGEVLAFVW